MKREDAIGVVALLHRRELHEARGQEARADEENRRHRHLADNEGHPERVSRRAVPAPRGSIDRRLVRVRFSAGRMPNTIVVAPARASAIANSRTSTPT